MEHDEVIRYRTSSYFDGPTSKKRVLGTRLQRKWLLYFEGSQRPLRQMFPWNYKSLPKIMVFSFKDLLFNDLGTPQGIYTEWHFSALFRVANCQAPSCAKCSSKSPSGLCNTKTSTPEPRSISTLEVQRTWKDTWLVGWTNPSEKYESIWVHLPHIRHENKHILETTHHLDTVWNMS